MQGTQAKIVTFHPIPTQLSASDGVWAGRDDLVCGFGPCRREQSEEGGFCQVPGPLRSATNREKLSVPLYRVECHSAAPPSILALAQPTCAPPRAVRHPARMRHLHASAATSPHAAGSRPEDFHLSKCFKGNAW